MPTNQSLLAHLDAAVRDHLTGSLTLGKPPGKIYFLMGSPMHATASMPEGEELVGLDAIRELARRCPKTVPAEKINGDKLPQGVNLAGTSLPEIKAAIKAAQQQAAPTRAFIEELPSLPSAPPLPPLPLLPAGTSLFQKMPLEMVNFDLLLGTLPNSMITIESAKAVGVALIKDGALDTAFHHDGSHITWDDEALVFIRAMQNATVTVHILPADVIETIPAIVATRVAYDGLQLEWLVWPRFVAELTRRGGLGVIELETTAGSGVLILREGNKPIVYTDAHPAPGEVSLLDPLIASGIGSLRVRHSQVAVPSLAPTPTHPAPESPVVEPTNQPAPPPQPESSSEVTPPQPDSVPAPPPSPPPAAVDPAPAEAPFSMDDLGEDIDIELTPAGDGSSAWDDALQFTTTPPEPQPEAAQPTTSKPTPLESKDQATVPSGFPQEQLNAAVQAALGIRASRLAPILEQARTDSWSPEALAEAVRQVPFPALSPEKIETLAVDLEKILRNRQS